MRQWMSRCVSREVAARWNGFSILVVILEVIRHFPKLFAQGGRPEYCHVVAEALEPEAQFQCIGHRGAQQDIVVIDVTNRLVLRDG